ncbi:MAG: hypothetical protein WB762_34805 [Candidatus Sulfotelmatobacter sp.]
MRSSGPQLFLFFLILAAIITLACGSATSPTRILQTVNISPPSAEGQVQFTALGFYEPPYPAPVVLTATWGACYQNAPTTEVTVSSAGFAQCSVGGSGTYTVFGSAPSGARVCPDTLTLCGGGGCQVAATAQLTCP